MQSSYGTVVAFLLTLFIILWCTVNQLGHCFRFLSTSFSFSVFLCIDNLLKYLLCRNNSVTHNIKSFSTSSLFKSSSSLRTWRGRWWCWYWVVFRFSRWDFTWKEPMEQTLHLPVILTMYCENSMQLHELWYILLAIQLSKLMIFEYKLNN